MARKLICMVALISLVLLAQTAPGWADTYYLPTGGEDPRDPLATWTEVHGNGIPGNAGGEFMGGYPNYANYSAWKIARLTNPVAGEVIADDGVKITYFINYSNLYPGGGIAGGNDPTRFVVETQGLNISSSDFVLTATAEYNKVPDGAHWKCWWENILGYGTNDLDNGSYFTLTGSLVETQADSNHYGYLENFQLEYTSSAVPIPGAIWLLGTGLVGLTCLGWRRKK